MAVGVSVLAAETKYSTRSAIGWPVHCERSLSLGPNPARQKSRSTIAWVNAGGGVGGGEGGAGATVALVTSAGVVMNRIRVRRLWRSPSIVRTA